MLEERFRIIPEEINTLKNVLNMVSAHARIEDKGTGLVGEAETGLVGEAETNSGAIIWG